MLEYTRDSGLLGRAGRAGTTLSSQIVADVREALFAKRPVWCAGMLFCFTSRGMGDRPAALG